jgi:phosphate transport system permease protein
MSQLNGQKATVSTMKHNDTRSEALQRLSQRVLDRSELPVEWLIRLCGWSAILFVSAIFFFVFKEGAPALLGLLNLHEFFSSVNWRPDSEVRAQYGILALLLGTLSVTGFAMLLAVPLGLGAAVYIAEFPSRRVKETLKVVIELLAVIPSVVWGFIGYMVIGPIIIGVTGAPVGLNVLNGGLILALMSVPVIMSVSEDALRAVPDSYREAALAMGASRWEIIYRVLFPAAKNGLLAAVLLGVGRAIGETMAVLMATGHAVQIPHGLLDPVRTLTATIAAELGEAVRGDSHYQVLFVIGMVLFGVAFVVNLTADLVVKGVRGEQHD